MFIISYRFQPQSSRKNTKIDIFEILEKREGNLYRISEPITRIKLFFLSSPFHYNFIAKFLFLIEFNEFKFNVLT
jgi:hypothetical protein